MMKKAARIAGLLYLLLIFVGMFGVLFVRDNLVMAGDPAKTADNILKSPLLWRIGIATDLLMHVLDIPIMLIIYVLLRPVSKNIALMALLFNLVQTAVLVANKLNLAAALLYLGNQGYLRSLDPVGLHAQMYLSLKLHDIGFGIGLIFFGFTCLINGFLVFRSGYLPKTIGILLQIAGACYLLNSFTLIVAPVYASSLFPFSIIPAFVAELSFSVWLLVRGVDISKWTEKANARQPSQVF
jgi:hypothetical protein